MNDSNTTLDTLKEQVHQLCLRKGWGVDGVQNPQHVAMAMTVEMSELLEHFQWLNPEDVQALLDGKDPERAAMIAEEYADVMMYGLQLMRALNIDITEQIIRNACACCIGMVVQEKAGEPVKKGKKPVVGVTLMGITNKGVVGFKYFGFGGTKIK